MKLTTSLKFVNESIAFSDKSIDRAKIFGTNVVDLFPKIS